MCKSGKLMQLGSPPRWIYYVKTTFVWAAQTGESTAKLVDTILAGKVHPQQGLLTLEGLEKMAPLTSQAIRKQQAAGD